ncbi:hypothetical protein KP509_02G092200 [Ceratopteris richardii]|uniref:Glycosyltransferase n=1 Tax=Ceratopteris richardii TaxID=49495 RepID=A0A8T2VFL0_CERRI|nr:hypothetical protein KP509_02G092200 [Ceratopteris richardii]KAH7444795.1 hypothetical protein KP509_02G092200 [Ceratopteris richardii]
MVSAGMEWTVRDASRGKKVHLVAIPYPAQGHIVPLMQFCRKITKDEDVMVTFVNTEHNHARMLQSQSDQGLETDEEEQGRLESNLRLVGLPGGLPPELHGDPAHVVAAFEASENLQAPLEELLKKMAQKGEPASCIISDVLMSWTQVCADRMRIPRIAFWTSSAAVYHVIWHMYILFKQGKPSFKVQDRNFQDSTSEMVSSIPGLPPMDLNDLPIIVRSDPADFIHRFLCRQLDHMVYATAMVINTFDELERECLRALPSNFPVPTYAIGPLLPRGSSSSSKTAGPPAPQMTPGVVPTYVETETRKPYLLCRAGIFNEDCSCLDWLDKKQPGSVVYISFGSIYAMSKEQFVELVVGLQDSGHDFLWSIRADFVQGCVSYRELLPRSFLECIEDRGMMVSWVPQLKVLAHEAVGGFLTHCGWNSTLESVVMGVPMLCWPDVGERRTNGRLAVTTWEVGLDFSNAQKEAAPSGTPVLLIPRVEVRRLIHLLMDPGDETVQQIRRNAASLRLAAEHALAANGSSAVDWKLFLNHIPRPSLDDSEVYQPTKPETRQAALVAT